MTAKEEFRSIVAAYITRDGISETMDHLERTDFYTAPASTKYHDSEEGGLVKHSIKVFKCLLEITSGKGFDKESLAIVALFHDFCKIGFYTVEYRNTKDERGQWIKVPFYGVKDLMPFGHGEKSVFMVLQYMKLSAEEAMAIRWHMGGFEPKESYGTMSEAYGQFPLAVYLHMADLMATYVA